MNVAKGDYERESAGAQVELVCKITPWGALVRIHTFKGNVWGATIWGPPFFVRITLSNKGEVEKLRAPLSVEVLYTNKLLSSELGWCRDLHVG